MVVWSEASLMCFRKEKFMGGGELWGWRAL